MDETIGKAGPGRNLGEQISAANARQQAIEAGLQFLSLIGRRAPQRRDGQAAVLDRSIGQRASGGSCFDFGLPLAHPVAMRGDPVGRTAAHRETELPFDAHRREGRGEQEIVVEHAIGTAAVDPDRARGEPVAQMNQHRDLPGAPVERAIRRHDNATPFGFQERQGCLARQDRAAVRIEGAEEFDRPEQRIAGTGGAEAERGEEGRQEAANRRIAFHHLVKTVLARTGQFLGRAQALFERRPSNPLVDERQRVPPAATRVKQRASEADMQPGSVAV